MFSTREIFDLAIQIEKNGEIFYRDALKKISVPSLRSLLQWLADQEVKHNEWFTQKKEAIKTEADGPTLDEMSILLQEILGDQSFSLKETDPSNIDKVEDLLLLAIEFEKDTILFYEMIGSLIDDAEISGKLKEIIGEENRHIQLLEEFQEEGVKMGEKPP